MIRIIAFIILMIITTTIYSLDKKDLRIIKTVAYNMKIDPVLLTSICFIESNHNSNSVHIDDNGSNSIGFCQIKLQTAKLMGYKGSEKGLLIMQVNLIYSAKYLKFQLNRYQKDVRKAILAYNSGTYKLSKKRKGMAINEKYYKKVLLVMNEIKCNKNLSFLLIDR